MSRRKEEPSTRRTHVAPWGRVRTAAALSERLDEFERTWLGRPDLEDLHKEAAETVEALQHVLPIVREHHLQLARELADLKAKGSRKEAAKVAFMVAEAEGAVALLEGVLAGSIPMAEWRGPSGATTTRGPASAEEQAVREALKRGRESERRAAEANRLAFERTGNPLYVFDTLSSFSSAGGDVSLPGWCVDYLGRAAYAIMEVAESGAEPDVAASAVPRASGLTRRGWNAFQAWNADRRRKREADSYDRVKAALRVRDKDAAEAAAEVWGLGDERSVRRRLSKARGPRPRRTKPAP